MNWLFILSLPALVTYSLQFASELVVSSNWYPAQIPHRVILKIIFIFRNLQLFIPWQLSHCQSWCNFSSHSSMESNSLTRFFDAWVARKAGTRHKYPGDSLLDTPSPSPCSLHGWLHLRVAVLAHGAAMIVYKVYTVKGDRPAAVSYHYFTLSSLCATI